MFLGVRIYTVVLSYIMAMKCCTGDIIYNVYLFDFILGCGAMTAYSRWGLTGESDVICAWLMVASVICLLVR